MQSTKADARGKPSKPYADYPLYAHANGQWSKKVRGKTHFFGRWDEPDAALEKWKAQQDDLRAGRTPRLAGDGLSVKELVNRYLSTKQAEVLTLEISQRHFSDLFAVCQFIANHFGKNRLVVDLAADDFEQLRNMLAKTNGYWALSGRIVKIRSVFKYAYEAGLIDKPMRFGPAFRIPSKNAHRRERMDKRKSPASPWAQANIGKANEIVSKPPAVLNIGCRKTYGRRFDTVLAQNRHDCFINPTICDRVQIPSRDLIFGRSSSAMMSAGFSTSILSISYIAEASSKSP